MKTLVNRTQPRIGSFPRIFDEFFFGEDFKPRHFQAGFPSVNIKEEETGFTLELAVPGYSKEDLSISIENDMLIISSTKNTEEETQADGYTRKEFSYRSFSRSFTLPEFIDLDKIDAKTEHGVLTISLPKKDELLKDKVKTIEIK